MYIAEDDLYIVILRNCVDVYTEAPSYIIGNLIADAIIVTDNNIKERVSIRLTEEQLQQFVGLYKFEKSPGKRKISLNDGKIYYERPPRKQGNPWSKNHIKPMSLTEFFSEGKQSTITFQFNDNKEVVKMIVNQMFGRKVHLNKIE